MQTTHIQPISYLKANAAQILKDLARDQKPLVITQNGQAAGVLLDVDSFEKSQETLALLKILAIGNAQVEKGLANSAAKAFSAVRRKARATA